MIVAAETQLRDRTDGEQRRYDRARESRGRAALKRSAGEAATGELDLYSAPDDETQKLVADFGHTMASANVLMAEYEDFTEAFRLFVDVLIGLAGDRTDWFEANDKLIALHSGRSVKWVQRTRKEIIVWQKRRETSYLDVEDHLYDPQNGNQPHKYRVHVARIAAESTLDARASAEWRIHPGKALEKSTNNLRAMLPTPVHTRRKQQRPADAEKQINRALKHIGTLMLRVEEIRENTGGHVPLDLAKIEDLENRLAVLKAAALDPLSTTLKEKVVDINRARRSAAPLHSDLSGRARAQDLEAQKTALYKKRVDALSEEQHAEYERAFDEVKQHNIDKGMTPRDAHIEARDALGDILAFFEGKEGGGHRVYSPLSDRLDSTVSGDSPTETYMAAMAQIYDREIAKGRTEKEARDAVDDEIGTFSQFLNRRDE